MKKLIPIVLLLLLIASPAYPFSSAIQAVVGAGGVAAPASCGAYIGNGTLTATRAIPSGYIHCMLATSGADCTASVMRIYSTSDDGSTATLCAYSTAGSTANPGTNGSSNLKLQCTAANAIADTTTAWVEANLGATLALTNGANYWLCVFAKTANFSSKEATTASWFYKSCAGCVDTPPADLTGTFTEGSEHRIALQIK